MRWWRPLALAGLFWARPVEAQFIKMSGGQLSGRFEAVQSNEPSARSTAVTEYRLWFELPVQGAIFDSKILAYDVKLKPVFQRRYQDGYAEPLAGKTLDLAFGVRLLPRKFVSFSLAGSRGSGSTSGGFGSARDFQVSNLRANLHIRFKPLPIQVAYSRGAVSESWRNLPGQVPLLTENSRRELWLLASNSKTSVMVRRLIYDDLVEVSDLQTWSVLLTNIQRWGKGSDLNSRYDYADQQGRTDANRKLWSERLHLQHTTWLSSDHTFRRMTNRLNGNTQVSSTSWSTGFDARIGRRVSVGAQLARSTAGFDRSRQSILTATPRVGANFRISPKLRVRASVLGGIEWRQGGTGGTVPVVDEAHQVQPNRSFTLDQPNVVASSLTLSDPATSNEFLRGIDYVVMQTGVFLRIDVPPGSRIQVGQTVLASYQFQVPQEVNNRAIRFDYDVSVHWGHLTIHHGRSLRSSERPPVLGNAVGISDFDEMRTTARWSSGTPLGYFTVDAGLRWSERQSHRTNSADASAQLVLPPLARLQPTIGSTWSATETDTVMIRSWSLDAGAEWMAMRGLVLRATVSGFYWYQAGTPTQRFLSATLTADWRFRGIAVGLRAEHHRREFLRRQHTSRLSLQLVRYF